MQNSSSWRRLKRMARSRSCRPTRRAAGSCWPCSASGAQRRGASASGTSSGRERRSRSPCRGAHPPAAAADRVWPSGVGDHQRPCRVSWCVFAEAGFAEVSRPTLRRIVMRIDVW